MHLKHICLGPVNEWNTLIPTVHETKVELIVYTHSYTMYFSLINYVSVQITYFSKMFVLYIYIYIYFNEIFT